MARAPQLQGVDLRLDQFDLSEATQMSDEDHIEVKPLEECVAVGDAFFACLDGSNQLLNDGDRALLQSIFNPALSDRRKEGDLFMPPSSRHVYLQKLRALVKAEESLCTRRKEAFLSIDFKMSAPGTFFPRSWTPLVEIAEDFKSADATKLRPCPEYKEAAADLLMPPLHLLAPPSQRQQCGLHASVRPVPP